MNVVPRTRTPVTMQQVRDLLLNAYTSELGRAPSKSALGSLSALVGIETARGSAINNFNFGNISASESFRGDAWRPPWFEILPGSDEDTPRNRAVHEMMIAGKAPSAFRAYPDRSAGMREFVAIVHRSFPEVLSAAELGDPEAFRAALAQKYSKDYENTKSTESLRALMQEAGISPKVEVGRALAPSLFPWWRGLLPGLFRS